MEETMGRIVYIVYKPTTEQREQIKGLMKKHVNNAYEFRGNQCGISVYGELTPEGIEALVSDAKELNLPGWHLKFSFGPESEEFLVKVPKPDHATLSYELRD